MAQEGKDESDFTVDADSSTSGPYTMSKDPTIAILCGIIPGGGQLYTEDYWKVPVFFGAAATFAGLTLYYNGKFNEQADLFDSLPNGTERDAARSRREFYRDNRDLNFAYFLAVELLGMVDAYVGAHLYDFDVGDELSLQIYPDPAHIGVGVSLRW